MKRSRKARAARGSRKVFLFVVEGCTEENYIKILRSPGFFPKKADTHNCEGGNAQSVLFAAEKRMRMDKDYYSGYVVWFDADGFDHTDKNMCEKLRQKGADIYVSEPCVENWLLAHFEPVKSKDKSCPDYEKKLRGYIPDYKKNDYQILHRFIKPEHVQQAIGNYPEIGRLPQKYFLD